MSTAPTNEPILAQPWCPVCQRQSIAEWGRVEDMDNAQVLHSVYRCSSCRHVYVHTPITASDLRRAYAGTEDSLFFNPQYYEERKTAAGYTHAELWVLDHVTRFAATGGNFLDVGSVQPRTLKSMLKRGWNVTAVEPGAQGQKMAAEIGCTVHQQLLEDVTFPHQFDLISALDVLEHSLDPIEFLRTIEKALKPEGVALLRFPNSASLRRLVNGVKWEMIKPLGHLHFFSPSSFAVACRQAGLRINHWCSRDVYQYCELRLPSRIGSIVWRMRPLWDGFGWGDQMLVCVSKSAGSCPAYPSRGQRIWWKEPDVGASAGNGSH